MQNSSAKKIQNISLLLCVLSVVGCASKPREVTASIPLVSFSQDKPDKQLIPVQYWPMLANAQQTTLTHEKYQIQLEQLYTSALGMTCRALTIIDGKNNLDKQVACEVTFINAENKPEKAWFMEKQIVESSGYIEL